jgi:hypothetical protein
MSNLSSLEKRADSLLSQLQPRPRLIHCAGAKDALLARVSWHRGEETQPGPDREAFESACSGMHAMIAQGVARVEQDYQVKFVE